MHLDKIGLLLESNNITRVMISSAVTVPGKWMVQFERKGGEIVPLTARRDNIRYFASSDSAIKILKELGCTSADISWSGQP